MGKISLIELAAVLSKRYGVNKKDATGFVTQMFDIIQQSLEQDKLVKIKGLGTFKIIDVDDRESVNVNTGERVLIEGHPKITFVPDALMKELVNKPFSQFETVVLNDGVDFEDAASEPSVAEPEIVETEPAVLESESEPAAMPLVDFEPEPEPELIPVSEPEAAPKSEPAPKPEAAPEPEPVQEPAMEAEPEQEAAPETETEEESESMEEEYEEEASDGKKWWLALLALLIGLAGGYILGNYFPFSTTQTPQQEVVKPVVPDSALIATKAAVDSIDSVTVAEPEVEEVKAEAPKVAEPKVETPKAEAPKAEAPKAAEPDKKAVDQLDQYQKKDSRVRTGAWRIVGTAQVVKVKEGETLSRISRRYLGPDMECYIEVYNNLTASTPLKAGQEIKIPQLKHKKSK
jgi:nucleoid DNA-binding protein/LysM repeat protein